jgi:pre-mRNA-processing factor SLU7
VHLQSAPSQAELLFRDFRNKKENLKSRTKEAIMEKYGGEEHMETAPRELLLAQTEQYVEYSASGKVIKGQEQAEAKSKYEEDVYINNHTQVWGSYWENGEWGFGCCKQLSKSSYCTGAAGRAIRDEILRGAHLGLGNVEQEEEVEEEKALADPEQQKKMKKLREKQAKEKAEKEEKEKEVRFKKALKSEDKRAREEVEKDERKRQFNSRSKEDYNVTEEEMEAYRLKRQRGDDPMKDFVEK